MKRKTSKATKSHKPVPQKKAQSPAFKKLPDDEPTATLDAALTSIRAEFTHREWDTVLAALRHWQQDHTRIESLGMDSTCDGTLEYAQWQLATEHGEPLTDEDIDKLVKRINCSSQQEDPVVVVEGGMVQSVFVPDPENSKRCIPVVYSLIDYDALKDGMADDDIVEEWNSFSPALKQYYRTSCKAEFEKYFKNAILARAGTR